MEQKILEIMKRVFKTDAVDTDTNQHNCDQWDSLRHLTLIVELEDAFDVEFEPEEIAVMNSFDAVAKMLSAKQSTL